jgi:hypothetical protein
LIVAAELALHDPVGETSALLLTKLEGAVRDSASPAEPLLAGRGRPPLKGALRPHAALALQVELVAVTPAESTDGPRIAGHGLLLS